MKRIKVTHILYSFEVGGIESLVLQFCNLMNKENYEFHIITLTNEDLQMVKLLPPQVKVHSLNLKKSEIKSIRGLVTGIKELKNFFNSISPDIIHSHLTSLPLLFIATAMKFSKIKSKHIRTVHTAGLFYENQETIPNKIKLLSEKIAMRLIKTNIVGVSSTADENNKKLFTNIANDIKLITNGIDLKKYNKEQYQNVKKENFGVGEDCILVSYVARLSYEKNHELLIDIWSEVIKKIPNAVLVIAGDGELHGFLKQKVKEYELEQNIKFLGLINNVPELLSVTDIGVFPSSNEGFGLVLIENFAMKIPVVASDIKSFQSIAKDEQDAFLIPVKDKKMYLTKILELCIDVELRKKIGENAYKVAQNYSIEKTVHEYDFYYKDSLKDIINV